ncbi:MULTISPECIES: ROK family protein [unclassified Spirosoma]|uniref:ROK family protein n=1 Tax=unclassified Spirosoma TaxID=2621999 RepID=UPI0009668B8A|nr:MULTISPECIES: ROK family protein [unclassified Spirosoma]MBN8822490.1 ROK family protein [Spirosoma sp.]OJW73999.1 MAG: sugar kinase [Spirosoma sp. 48-14]
MRLGIEIGGTKLQLFTSDEPGQITQRFRLAIDPAKGAEGILAQIASTINQITTPIQSIGVGFGGPVDWQTGRIATSHQIGGWSGFNLGEWLQQQVPGAQVRVENDANVAALGEALRGVATGFRNVFYVTLGSGVGGGMVVDRQLYHGALPGEAEIGHLWLVPPSESSDGQTIEQTVSGWAVDQQIRSLLPQLPDDSYLKQAVQQAHAGGTTGKEARFLHPAYEASDPVAKMLIEQIGSVLALGLSHVTHLFHPDAIVLGGGLSLIGEPLRAAVRQALPRFVMKAFHPAPIVLLAKLGEDAVPIGALELMGEE